MLPSTIQTRDQAFADIPPDVVPNYVNPDWNGDYYIVGASVTLAFAAILVLGRVSLTIFLMRRRPNAQEYLSVIALLFAIARATCYIIDVLHFGMGHHIWDVALPFSDFLWRLATIGNTMYPIGILFAKIAIILFYLQLFGRQKVFRWLCWALIGIDIGYLGAYFLMSIFWCNPIIAAWSISALNGQPYVCLNGYEIDLAIGGLNLFSDLCILLLPMPVVLRLKLSLTKRLGIAVVFAVGIFAIVTVIIREIIIQQKLNNEDADQTWAVVYEATWLSIELHIALICGSALALPQSLRYAANNTAIGSKLFSSMADPKYPKYHSKESSGYPSFRSKRNAQRLPSQQSQSSVNQHDVELGGMQPRNFISVSANKDTPEPTTSQEILETRTFQTESVPARYQA